MFYLLNYFMNWLNCRGILVYNEFSLQFELGCFLRSMGYTVRYERNVSAYIPKGNANQFIKKEIDLVAFIGEDETKANKKIAIELKFPRNAQYPEQMYKFIEDIKFMEQVGGIQGFAETYVLCLVDNHNYYQHQLNQSGIYDYFRKRGEIIGIPGKTSISKPTGKKNKTITLSNANGYSAKWLQPTANWLDPLSAKQKPLKQGEYRYYIIGVKSALSSPSAIGNTRPEGFCAPLSD